MSNRFVPSRMIVRMPNWLGDLVMATPLLADLRRHWPQAKITAMCQGGGAALLEGDPHVDQIWGFKRPKHLFSRELISPLQQGNYDLALLLTNSFSSAWWFWRGGVPHRLGYATPSRRWLLNLPLSFPPSLANQPLVVTYKGLLEPLGIPVSETPPCLYLTSLERKKARERLAQYGICSTDRVIGINPGAAYGSAKCWLPERFKQLCQLLLEKEQGVRIIFFGDQAGASLVDQICEGLPSSVINLVGQTSLRELLALIEACSLFLTNDSGPMHVAAALGVPLIALFGSTNDRTTGPYQGVDQGKPIVIHKRVPCSPCYRRECPLIDFPCMSQISVEEVYQVIRSLF